MSERGAGLRVVHPLDRVLTVYRLEVGRFWSAQIMAVSGRTPVAVLPGFVIDRDAVFELPRPGAR
jgi:hypothetical protein